MKFQYDKIYSLSTPNLTLVVKLTVFMRELRDAIVYILQLFTLLQVKFVCVRISISATIFYMTLTLCMYISKSEYMDIIVGSLN